MTVYLVGAGPGDAGLLTCRAEDLLAVTEVVVHDGLVGPDVLDLVNPSAERVSVAKSPGHASLTQAAINDLLVELGGRHAHVVRLKGGDPYVFGRGAEEAAALAVAGIACEVVPGVTSAMAAPAVAGIPVTTRDLAPCVTIVTGHEDPDRDDTVDWRALARTGGTLVVLMGVGRMPAIVTELLAGGMAPDTPVAAVRWGTRPEQTTIRATLATITDHPLRSPSTIVIGAVAALDLGVLGAGVLDQVGGPA